MQFLILSCGGSQIRRNGNNETSAATGLNNKHIICIKTYLHILILYHLIVYVGLYLLNIYYILHYIFATIYTQTEI